MDNKNREIPVINIVETIRNAVVHGVVRSDFARPLYNSLIKYYSFSSRDGERWEDATFSPDDFEARMSRFANNTRGAFEDRNTAEAYKSRAMRAIEVYYELIEHGKVTVKSRRSSAYKMTKRTNSLNDDFNKLWFSRLKEVINKKGAEDNHKVILFPTQGQHASAVIVPKATAREDLSVIYETLRLLFEGLDSKKEENA